MLFPDLSVSAPNHRPAGDATTPAPQSTVPAGTRCPLTKIPSESTLVTRALVKTSTPKLSKCCCALIERSSGYVGRMRGPASYRRIRADLGSICRKSCAKAMRDISASVLAISTPTVPAPTSANVRRRRISVVANGRRAECREVGRIPAASQRLDQKHTRAQPPPQDIDIVSLVGEFDRLRAADLEVRVDAALVTIRKNLKGILR